MTTMTKLIGVGIAGVVVGVLVGFSVFSGGSALGGVYEQSARYFTAGFYAGDTDQLSVDADGDLTTTGDVTITTAANSTSTLVVGEIETYATSSATKVCLTFNTVATSSQAGHVLWNYGACP